ncbi:MULTISPECIES: hypothetical protein [unclassified Sphingobium]|uniref:hypothetical protein n=1 Tax=unclassified Sphingobium TaxID=2611147 RepID=UPI0022252838|nr:MULTISPECIES: hypothetical protein [unclassified Sphingobium]MCW2411746.1 hypothetical protein [Sphingobium sp. B8D3D]MCW2415958.1 hypothetical protein [Sphingobium sp. B8D3A]
MIRAVVIGQSHTVCIGKAAQIYPDLGRGVAVFRLESKQVSVGDGSTPFNEILQIIKGLPEHIPVFLSFFGTVHNVIGLVRQDADFDLILPGDKDSSQSNGSKIVPFHAMEAAFNHYIGKPSKAYAIRDAANGETFLISSPPPKARNDFIIARFREKSDKKYRGKDVVEMGLNNPLLRRKMWSIERDLNKHWADINGWGYLNPPQNAVDKAGFLEERYYEDATHANSEYGALVLLQIAGIIEKTLGKLRHG